MKRLQPFAALVGFTAVSALAHAEMMGDVDTAFKLLVNGLTKYWLEPDRETPSIAKTQV